ncbi:MAG: hypothetical protein GF308_22070 [Candidatus Heimdallarchaeota archaeon]|nr:hypothetical protein [Candidatus Heimdallarchaeota archaeon]
MCKKELPKTKDYLYMNTRLLERKLFEYFFENGSSKDCVKAIRAYQNKDGGFGNGIELDLLCPDSTAIGAETALYYFDLLDSPDRKIFEGIMDWVKKNQSKEGIIPHPPKNLKNYPHQPWWEKEDNTRIFSILGYLAKAGITNTEVTAKAKSYLEEESFPEKLGFYDYPYLLFLRYLGETKEEKGLLDKLLTKVPSVFEEHSHHFPLVSRYWYHLIDLMDQKMVNREAKKFLQAIEEDGGMPTIFEELPWWRAIFTLDGLIIIKKHTRLSFLLEKNEINSR